MSFTKKFKNKIKENNLVKRSIAGLASFAIAMTTFVSSFPIMKADAATYDLEQLVSGEDIIAQACQVLGVNYHNTTDLTSTYNYCYGVNSSSAMTSSTNSVSRSNLYSASTMKSWTSKGLSCAGMVYWTLLQTGFTSASGFTNYYNPIPYRCCGWYGTDKTKTSNGVKLSSSTKITWNFTDPETGKSGSKTVTPVKFEQKTSTKNYENGTDGYLRYWETSSGGTIPSGSVIIARNTSGGDDHAWIYLGEFDSKDDVVDYVYSICKLSGNTISKSTIEKYTSDEGTGGNHWRIEATSGSFGDVSHCVMIDNGETGKKTSAYNVDVYTIDEPDEGQIVLKKAFDDNGSIDKDGYISIKFTVEEYIGSTKGHSYSVTGKYKAGGSWTQTSATDSDSTPYASIGVTSGGSFYFKKLRLYDDGTKIKYKITETVVGQSTSATAAGYVPSDPWTITLADKSDDNTQYRYSTTVDNYGFGKIHLVKKFEEAPTSDTTVTIKVARSDDSSIYYTIKGKYNATTKKWSQVSTSMSSGAKKLRVVGVLSVNENGVFCFDHMPLRKSRANSFAKVKYTITETVTGNSDYNVSNLTLYSEKALANQTYDNTKGYWRPTVTNEMNENGKITLTKKFDEVTGGNAKIKFTVQSCNSSGTVDNKYNYSLTSTYTASTGTWSTTGTTSSDRYVTSTGKFVFQNLDMYNNGKTTDKVYYKVTETVESGGYYAANTKKSTYVVEAKADVYGDSDHSISDTVTNTVKYGTVKVKKTFSDSGAALASGEHSTITFYLTGANNTSFTTRKFSIVYEDGKWTTTGSTSSSADTYFDTSTNQVYFQNLPLYLENSNTPATYYLYEVVGNSSTESGYLASTGYSNKILVTPLKHTDYTFSKTIKNYPKGSITFTKYWKGQTDAIASTDEVTADFELSRSSNGGAYETVSTFTLTYDGNSSTTWTKKGLAVYDDDGNVYTYKIEEKSYKPASANDGYGYIVDAAGNTVKTFKLSSAKSNNYRYVTSMTNTILALSTDATVTKTVSGASDTQLSNIYKNLPIVAMIDGQYVTATAKGNGVYTYTGLVNDFADATILYIDSDINSSTFGYATIEDIDSAYYSTDVYFYEHITAEGLYYPLNLTNTTQYQDYTQSYAISSYNSTTGFRSKASLVNTYKTMYASFAKTDTEGNEIIGGLFGLYAAEDIVVDGETIYEKDELIESVEAEPESYNFSGTMKKVTKFGTALPAVNLNESEPRLFKYYVQEIEAPDGYVLDSTKYDIEWSDSFKTYWNDPTVPIMYYSSYVFGQNVGTGTATIIDTQLKIKKVDANGDNVYGNGLQILDSNGDVVETWVTTGATDGVHTVSGVELGETYTLHEAYARTGYHYADDITFTISYSNGEFSVTSSDSSAVAITDGIITITMVDEETCVKVHKVTEEGADLAGAELVLYDSDNDVVESWTSDGTAHEFVNTLIAGETYTLHEVTPPAGYAYADDVTFTVPKYSSSSDLDSDGYLNVTMTDKATTVYFTKTDITGSGELEGAQLQVTDSMGNIVDEWTSTDEAHKIIAVLVAGDTYTLHEEYAPNGYAVSNDIDFTVSTDGSIDTVEMVDDYTRAYISKITLNQTYYGDLVDGATYQIIDSDSNVVEEVTYSAVDGWYASLEDGATYTLHVLSVPEGTAADDVTFVAYDNTSTTSSGYTNEDDEDADTSTSTDTDTDDEDEDNEIIVEEEAEDNTVKVDMNDLTNLLVVSEERSYISGAVLQILDSNGDIVDEWTTADEDHLIEGVLVGGATYILHEASAPAGYAYAEDIEFVMPYEASTVYLEMVDSPTKVKISKQTITGEAEIEGAVLQVIDSNGEVIEEWTSTSTPHYIICTLNAGETYTLRETYAPDGYAYARDIEFTVDENGNITSVIMYDDVTKVRINKVRDTGVEILFSDLDGTYQILDENEEVVAELPVTDEDTGDVSYDAGLSTGTYTVVQSSDSATYNLDEEMTIDIIADDTYDIRTLIYNKIKYTYLEGASLQLLDTNGNVVDEWVSTTEAHYLEMTLIADATYTLHEVTAPDGYVLADDVTFTVARYGGLDDVIMVDDTTKVKITKYDITNGEELEGASLQVIDSNGNVVDEWVSTTEPHYIEGILTAGGSYTLHEEVAPDCYVVANDITFTVTDEGEVDVVEMYDDVTRGTIEIHKTTEGMLNVEGIDFVVSGTSDTGLDINLTATTDADGIATFEAVPTGTYTVTESDSTTPYAYLTADSVEVTVYYAETTTQEVYNNEKTGTLEVHKTTEGMLNVEGIDFVLSGTSDSGRAIEITATTDANGVATFENVPIGTYTVTESESSTPYAYLTADSVEVTVYYAETTAQEVYNSEKTGTLEVHKTTEGMLNVEGIDFVLSGTSDSGRAIEITATTNENGIATFESVPIGTYTITEDGDTVPYGYLTADDVSVEVYYAETTVQEVYNEKVPEEETPPTTTETPPTTTETPPTTTDTPNPPTGESAIPYIVVGLGLIGAAFVSFRKKKDE